MDLSAAVETHVIRIEDKKLGRKRDHSLDSAMLRAALEVLAECGYEGMTMNAVADKAKVGKAALYRRWPSKENLVLDAVTQMKRSQVDSDQLPDTGSLRGDLLALVKPQSQGESEFRLKVMAGLSSMIIAHQELADAGTAAIVSPWADAYFELIDRAAQRGEAHLSADIQTVSQIVPSMMAFRSIVLRKPFDLEYLISLVDGVLLPALGIAKV